MKNLILTLTTAALLSAVPGFSGDKAAECTCDQKCMEECHKGGENKKCDCKACDCAKSGDCEHHKCGSHDHDKKGTAKPKK